MVIVMGTVKLPSDLLDPETIHVAEQWRNRDALTEHFATPHMAEWRGVMGSLGLTGRDLKVFEADEGSGI